MKKKDEKPIDIERINKMMALPRQMGTDDGREIIVLTWQPQYSKAEGTIGVLIQGVVKLVE